MPDLNTLLLFSVAALALTMTPGPDMLLIASRSAAQGRSAGLATYAGIAVGTYAHGLAAAFGLSQLFIAVPVAYDVVRFAGAAYLLYLAWITFTVSSAIESVDSPTKQLQSFSSMFRQGFLTNLLNPKVALFVLALFPQFVDLKVGSVALQIMIFATVINVIGFFVNGAVIVMASKASTLLTGSAKVKNLLNNFLACVFLGLAIRLVFDSQKN